jgi:MoaA/NifB/PqqE/SkfB family radical SAM enzyme
MVHDWFSFLRKLTFRKISNYLILKVSYLLSVFLRKPVVLGYPAVATVEPTNQCNLKCIECPAGNGSMTRSKGNIDISLYRSFINELSPYLSYLMLYFQGEPLLHPQLTRLIKYAGEKKVYTSVSTNGHHLSRENVKEIVESGLNRIIISLDGTDQQSYQQYRTGGDFWKVLQGIANLVQIKKELKSHLPFIMLQFIVMSHNENQIDEVKALGKKLGTNTTVIKSLQVLDLKNSYDLLPSDSKLSRYRLNKRKELMIKSSLKNRCRRLWHTLVMLNDGCIVPCCFDKNGQYVCGKYPESSIADIWKGDKLRSFRQSILNSRRDIQICCNCTEGMAGTFL